MPQTIRQRIIDLLEEGEMSAREISGAIGITEKEVYGHLDHIRKTLARSDRRLLVHPARCKGCGFEFVVRQRLTKPGRCPGCRHPHITDPRFKVGGAR